MITVDVHTHTNHSHAVNSVAEMAEAAEALGMKVFGFSEHSPRPQGHDYPKEYREKLQAGFDDYLAEVSALRSRYLKAPSDKKPMQVLLGLEVDWFPDERPFIRKMIDNADYDYLIGSTHFLGPWGFDSTADDWSGLAVEECFTRYEDYFTIERDMASSGWMQIAAHPDLIKIFSVENFRTWMRLDSSKKLVFEALTAMKDSGMAMEVSVAGLRKMCKEIYPCEEIMKMAVKLELPISFASDAHATGQLAWEFSTLAEYAHKFGYTTSRYFVQKQPVDRPF